MSAVASNRSPPTPPASLPDVHAQDAVKRLEGAGGTGRHGVEQSYGNPGLKMSDSQDTGDLLRVSEGRKACKGLRTRLFKIHVSSPYILK